MTYGTSKNWGNFSLEDLDLRHRLSAQGISQGRPANKVYKTTGREFVKCKQCRMRLLKANLERHLLRVHKQTNAKLARRNFQTYAAKSIKVIKRSQTTCRRLLKKSVVDDLCLLLLQMGKNRGLGLETVDSVMDRKDGERLVKDLFDTLKTSIDRHQPST